MCAPSPTLALQDLPTRRVTAVSDATKESRTRNHIKRSLRSILAPSVHSPRKPVSDMHKKATLEPSTKIASFFPQNGARLRVPSSTLLHFRMEKTEAHSHTMYSYDRSFPKNACLRRNVLKIDHHRCISLSRYENSGATASILKTPLRESKNVATSRSGRNRAKTQACSTSRRENPNFLEQSQSTKRKHFPP